MLVRLWNALPQPLWLRSVITGIVLVAAGLIGYFLIWPAVVGALAWVYIQAFRVLAWVIIFVVVAYAITLPLGSLQGVVLGGLRWLVAQVVLLLLRMLGYNPPRRRRRRSGGNGDDAD